MNSRFGTLWVQPGISSTQYLGMAVNSGFGTEYPGVYYTLLSTPLQVNVVFGAGVLLVVVAC